MKFCSHSTPKDNLWQRALQTLSDEDRDRFTKHADRLTILTEILENVEAKKVICLSKGWKYKRNGKVVNVRDVLEKAVVWIQKFKDIGDIVVQYDPTHAALPWAGIRFLLQV